MTPYNIRHIISHIATASNKLRRCLSLLLMLLTLGSGINCAWGQTTYKYYAIHNKDKGYLKQAKGAVANENSFRYENAHNDNGSSIWVLSSDGYLQQEMYYLNVANDATLYLSTEKVTQWTIDNTTISGKNLLKPNGSSKYLCADDGPQLKASPSNYYNACEMTVAENNSKWTGPSDVSFTVQSPQLVTYIRTFFTRNITVTILKNDADKTNQKVVDKKDSRSYCSLTYNTTSDANKGTTWDINETTGVIYSKQASGDVSVAATYSVAPLDPIVLSNHSATTATVTLKLQPSPFAPNAEKNYLLYYTKDAGYRFPYDDGLNEDSPVKTNAGKNVLTEPANNQISWKVIRDDEGFYSFQNVNSGRWLRFDESHYVDGSNYGVVEMGVDGNDVPTTSAYKFRLYKSGSLGNGSSQPTYCILPYCKQYAVYKSDGVLTEALTSLNVYKNYNIISIWKAGNDSKYCILAYEAEYRIRNDFSVTGPATANALGTYDFTADSYYFRAIKGSATSTDAQRDLEINGSFERASVDFNWTVVGLDGYYNTTQNVSNGTGTLHLEITSLPASGSVTGTIKTQAKAYTDINNKKKTSDWKTVPFVLYSSPSPTTAQEISSLASITNANGIYRLTADVSDMPGVENFNGFLDGNGHHITSLSAPLFSTLTNATIRNLTIDNATISQSGKIGAIAGTADGGTVIYNVGLMSGSVASTDDYCGGLVGLLKGTARVINCFSYANITNGTYVGGIVGYNNETTKSTDLKTMVMNCMFYGDISGGTNKAPIYNGKIITNRGDASGVSNFNYFWGGASYVTQRDANNNPDIQTYNCALLAETRYLQRFEFFRHVLNAHRELAAWWATGSADNKDLMMKWVLEPSQIGTDNPYPILKTPGKYASVVNYTPSDVAIDAENKHYNEGRKLTNMGTNGELTVTIEMGSGGNVYSPPSEASITTSTLKLTITDKDPAHFNFNYGKVQLPYYNDVGTKNYNGNRVVTGWKIVSITGGGSNSFSTDNDNNASTPADATATVTDGDITLITPCNFADRNCTDKDLFGVSGRVFSQGAYWDVPEGVTAITIQPYWAKAAYVADAYLDVVYDKDMNNAYNVTTVGGGEKWKNDTNYPIAGENQKVYTTIGNARNALDKNTARNVYDCAIVLVGNVHSIGVSSGDNDRFYTIMSADFDHDNEPDYSYILRFNSRVRVHPVRIDFLNVIGLGMAQKSNEGKGTYNFGIMQPTGWFECTNTGLFRVTQFEYDLNPRTISPIILQGGIIEQWVTYQNANSSAANAVQYFHVGGNVWFKEFHMGVHQDRTDNKVTPHPPVSVTGGDFNELYLTGLYNSPNSNYDDNAECYINGGHFSKVAGTGMQGIGNASTHANGNIIWQIDNADIDEFYAGGINAAHKAEGSIYTVISNSRVDLFCGGPKFGDMNSNEKVVTNATNCTFRTFFGAGYGGNSYNRRYPNNQNNKINIDWDSWLTGTASYDYSYDANYGGVETRIDYQFLPMSGNLDNVCRLFIDYVSFSLATTYDVTTKLTGCTITKSPLGRLDISNDDKRLGNFYGGGSLGKVDGPVKSTLTNCTVEGNVFGAGYSATQPTVNVMAQAFQTQPHYDENLGAYLDAILPATTEYTWEHAQTVNATNAINTSTHKLFTSVDLSKSNLGSVSGAVTLTITTSNGNNGVTEIGTNNDPGTGHVYGGGDESFVSNATNPTSASTTVTISGNTTVKGNVFGGGNNGDVSGSTTVNIED